MTGLIQGGTLTGVITVSTGGGGGGGNDTLNTLFNTPAGQTHTPFEMSDDNENHACYGFANGLDVVLPDTVTSIESMAFYGSGGQSGMGGGIVSISGNGVTNIGDNAFSTCGSLRSLNLPAVEAIGSSAFSYTKFTTARFPVLRSIGSECFGYNDSLTDLYIGYDGVCTIGAYAFNTWGSRKVNVHVRADQLANYQSDSAWADAVSSNKVELIGDYE